MLKHGYPGDRDFAIDRYWKQPYHYVIFACDELNKLKRAHLHALELPTANLSSIIVNQNRNPKKQVKPFTYKDFLFFAPLQDKELPEGHFGAAAMELHRRGDYPSWALFCFSELNQRAAQGYKPQFCALISDDAILLHPVQSNGGYKGMLIAREAASRKVIEFTRDDGEVIKLTMPEIKTKIIAEEEAILFP